MSAGAVYRGYRRDGRARVAIEDDGRTVDHLIHVVKHSPSGIEWGYGGSGPADLARSLLLDALGDKANRCRLCGGAGRIAAPMDGDGLDYVPFVEDLHNDLDEWDVTGCWDCSDGYVEVPYQAFKFDVVAGLAHDGWLLPRQQVVDWLARNGVAVPQ